MCGRPFTHFSEYEIAQLLSKIRHTSSGLDDLPKLPYWLFQKCSFALAGIVTSLLNKSFSTGTVPSQWLTAVVTPIPKKSSPTVLSDYRPISVTPILSRLAEKIFVQQWLRPALPMKLLEDQYAFRHIGSTCWAVVDFIHHSTPMLENNSYTRCLFIDFSKAFDVVRHSTLLSKISSLNIPPMALNLIIAFLTGRSQFGQRMFNPSLL